MTLADRVRALDEAAAVELLVGMLSVPSPSYHEQAVAEHLRATLERLGFDARIDPAGNVVGEIVRGDGPTVLLLGHMDTIPGDLPVRHEDGRVHGRGSVDAKGPLAAMIAAALAAEDAVGRVVVAGAVEEETPCSRGAMRLRADLDAPDALVIGEPSGWDTVVLGYKGKLDLDYRVTCPATHPSNPEPKASELAALAWSTLLELLGEGADHGAFDRPGPTLVSIEGTLTEARAEMCVRTPPGFDPDALVAELRARLGAGELTVVNAVAACRTGRTDPVVRALSAGIRSEGGTPTPKLKTATSDMNTVGEVWSVPMATYGPGDSRLDHSDDEHILVEDFLRGIRVLARAIEELSRTERS